MNETVLEMHFHHALINLIRATLGLGSGQFNFYKYSPQRECFVGFDQAFVRTDLSEDELFEVLKADATQNGYSLSNFFVGLFLQYKVVKQMTRNMRTTPDIITSRPYLRVSIDTRRKDKTGFSQHELLYNLNRNTGAFVYYACPMIFERELLYVQNADLSRLRLVDVNTCPSDYLDNESHYIFFNDPDSNPVWRSNPVEGIALSASEMCQKLREGVVSGRILDSQLALLDRLASIPGFEGDQTEETAPEGASRLAEMVSESLIILRYHQG